ncbi:amidohydrolase [Roseomonas sp. NAR14]|uniref:Amidohydrolase n=1 Tax=Roseomonas acroporae TaxID=2937791 RepID=A0A9X1YBI7_9PROT|nr:amidohydrolase family protein [Roseomonas acroporae]MCK8787071.1 amidohydrolase [Roseomonas acroporae]
MAGIVDIHAHHVPPLLIDEVARHGPAFGVLLRHDADGVLRLRVGDGPPLRPVLPELSNLLLRLPLLDEQGVTLQYLSPWTDCAGDALPPDQGARWARLQNETMADSARAHGDRFEAMATLPMQDPGLAVAELEHAVRHLGLRAVELVTSACGRDLDHPDYRPLWRRLRDLDVFVLLHPPGTPVGMERLGDYFLNNLLGFPIETTIAASRLLFGGVMAEFPGLKVCLVHGGGFLPYQIGRLDRGFAVHPACRAGGPAEAPSAALRAFHYDTLTHDDPALDYLAARVGADRLLYGSDYPFEMLDPAGPARVRRSAALAGQAGAVLGGNAEALLPPRGAGMPG